MTPTDQATISVEMLNIERATSDRLREENNHLRNEVKKWQTLATQGIQIERDLRLEITRLQDALRARGPWELK